MNTGFIYKNMWCLRHKNLDQSKIIFSLDSNHNGKIIIKLAPGAWDKYLKYKSIIWQLWQPQFYKIK